MRLFFLLGIAILSFFLAGCPTTIREPSRDHERMPFEVKADTVPANHPLCAEPGPAFATSDECRNTQKYRITWDRPEDTVGLKGYRFYLDTNAHGSIPSGTRWETIQNSTLFADVLIGPITGLRDSLVFAVGTPQKTPDSLNALNPRILRLDTTGRFTLEGKAIMVVMPVYEDADAGRPGYGSIQIGDRSPPIPVQIEVDVFDRQFSATWDRPIDPTSFFDPGADTGIIKAYQVEVNLGGAEAVKRAGTFRPQFIGIVEGDTVILLDSVRSTAGTAITFTLPDGGHFHPKRTDANQDQIRLWVQNLNPQDTFNLKVIPIDDAGNVSSKEAAEPYKIILTDTTRPEKPELEADSAATTRNRLVMRWSPSRDSVVIDGILKRAESPDQGIREYRLRREWLVDSVVQTFTDTIISAGLPEGQSQYQDTLHRLAPGREYRFIVIARDSSGYRSLADTLSMRTLDVTFADAESTLTCPPGFLPMPGKRVVVGDTSINAQADERPARTSDGSAVLQPYVASFCIEPTEHRDTSGAFMVGKSWQEADAICRAISAEDSTRLCTEVQWERACEGDDSLPHLYGYQGDRRDPSLLLNECNQGTGDSLPAISSALRGKQCLTGEGLFDMPGQLSEWVRDPYDASAMSRITADTLPYGFTLASTGETRSFRGGNFLRPNVPSAQLQLLARCSNRDVPREVRPKFKSECVDTVPRLLAIFGTDFSQHRCMPFKREPSAGPVRFIDRLLDSVSFKVEYDSNKTDILRLEPDSISKGKLALSAGATTVSLAAVRFVDTEGAIHEDTLEARELRDTSTTLRRQILSREAGVGYTVYEENGKPWVRFLYGYAQTSSRPARPNYASRIIGFRCCAKPR